MYIGHAGCLKLLGARLWGRLRQPEEIINVAVSHLPCPWVA